LFPRKTGQEKRFTGRQGGGRGRKPIHPKEKKKRKVRKPARTHRGANVNVNGG